MPYSEYTPAQKRLAAVAPPRKKITEADLKALRKGKKNEKKVNKSSKEIREGFKSSRWTSQNLEGDCQCQEKKQKAQKKLVQLKNNLL